VKLGACHDRRGRGVDGGRGGRSYVQRRNYSVRVSYNVRTFARAKNARCRAKRETRARAREYGSVSINLSAAAESYGVSGDLSGGN